MAGDERWDEEPQGRPPSATENEDSAASQAPEESAPTAAASAIFSGSQAAVQAPGPVVWGWRELGLLLVVACFGFFVCDFLLLAIYVALRPFAGWQTPVQALPANPIFAVVFQCLLYLLVFAYVYFTVKVRFDRPFREGIEWRKLTGGHALFYALLGVLLVFAVEIVTFLLPRAKEFPLEKLFNSPAAAYALGAFAVLVAPFMEELLFRGILFSFFESKLGVVTAVIATAALFAAFHVQEYWGAWSNLLAVGVAGLAFSLARGLTRSLAPSVILHTSYNATLMAALLIGTQQFHNLKTAAIL